MRMIAFLEIRKGYGDKEKGLDKKIDRIKKNLKRIIVRDGMCGVFVDA